MKRKLLLTVFTFTLTFLTSASAQACLPYCPWLDPFAWLGFYGCGCGYGGGYGAQNCGVGYGYQQPVYGGYHQPMYAPQAPIMNYPVAPTPGCNCTGALPQQQSLAAVQVPVTTYRPVTQYVPQTTYQTQYRYQTANSYAAPIGGGLAYPTTAYAQPGVGGTSYPATAYDGGAGTIPYYGEAVPSTFYPPSSMGVPQVTPGYGLPAQQPGDIAGDHEYPSQSALAPIPTARRPVSVIRPASYGVAPRPARTFSAAVR